MNNSSKTIVLLSLHRLGDSVFTIPAIEKIKQYYSNYKVIIICFHTNKDIYNYYFKNNIELILIKNHSNWFKERFPSWILINKVRKLKPEILFDISITGIYSFLFGLFAGAQKNIGMNKANLETGYDKFVVTRNTPHLIDMYLDVVRLVISSEKFSVNRIFKPNFNKNDSILINTLAGWKAKEWDFEKFVVLAKALSKEYKVLFIHQKGSVDTNYLKKNSLKYIETETIKELIDNLENCSLLIGNDSGPIYIASMLGKPTFTLYGPTNPDYSLPFGKHHKYCRYTIHCSPLAEQYCFLNAGRNCSTVKCLELLKVDDVLKNVQDFIKELGIENK